MILEGHLLRRCVVAVITAAVAVGCDGGRSTGASSPSGAPQAASSGSATQSATSSAASSSGALGSANDSAGSASAAASSSALASASAETPSDPLADAPKLFAEDGSPLPQTNDKPSTDSPAFKRRMELLWQAIVADDVTIAEASFFPSVAYEQVKDIKKPKADWTHRLMKAFKRNIHEYHKKLGDDPSALTFLGVEIDDKRVKLMPRGKEGNKLPYYRITRSKIRYSEPGGKEKSLELTSMISWRGEWFVVHLNGFK